MKTTKFAGNLSGDLLLTQRVSLLAVRSSFAYGSSLLLTVEIWLGHFYLRLKFGLVFVAYSGKSILSFSLLVPPHPEIGFGLFCLGFPHCR